MRSVIRLFTAAGLAGACIALPTTTAAAQKADAQTEPKRQYTKEFATALAPFVKALEAKDYAAASAAVEAARVKAKTPDEIYTVNQVALQIATAQSNPAAQYAAIEAMLASGGATATDKSVFNVFLSRRAYDEKRDDDALRYARAAKAAGSIDPVVDQIIVASAARQGDYATAIAGGQGQIDAMKAAGQVPEESAYRQLVGLAQRSKDTALEHQMYQQWIAAYPSTENWRAVLMNSMAGRKLGEPVQLDFFRLMRATNALSSADEWRSYAELASSQNLNGEVVAAVDAGSQAGVLESGGVREVYDRSKAKIAEDRASLINEARTASSKTTAKPVAAAADALMGYGEYAQAVDLYRIALTKPGVETDEVTLRMGIAQALSGDNAGAKTTFGRVGGDRQVLADYWTLWLDSRAGA